MTDSESFDRIFEKCSWKVHFLKKTTGGNPITKLKICPFGGITQSIFGLKLLKCTSSDYSRTISGHFQITVFIVFFLMWVPLH